jgi:pimeloyl-ACP methyl ester carboxylesterase
MSGSGKTLQRDDCAIAYEVEGPASGATAVLLHGFGMSRAAVRDLGSALREAAPSLRVVLADARGHGDTRAPERDDAHGYPTMRDDLIALIEREAPDGAHLVGHSMGGQIALMAGIARSDLVESLVLICAGPCRAITEEKEARGWERAAAAFENASRDELCQSLASAAPTDRAELTPESLYGEARGPDLARVVRGGFLHVESNDDACRDVTAPALVIAGGRDRTWIDPSRKLAELLPGSELRVVEDAGHLVHLEHASAVAGWIGDFLPSPPP